jgi:hypothetical protein
MLTALQWGKAACIRRAPNVQRAIEFHFRPAKGTSGRVRINHMARQWL